MCGIQTWTRCGCVLDLISVVPPPWLAPARAQVLAEIKKWQAMASEVVFVWPDDGWTQVQPVMEAMKLSGCRIAELDWPTRGWAYEHWQGDKYHLNREACTLLAVGCTQECTLTVLCTGGDGFRADGGRQDCKTCRSGTSIVRGGQFAHKPRLLERGSRAASPNGQRQYKLAH